MSNDVTLFEEEEIETSVPLDDIAEAKKELEARCKSCGIDLQEVPGVDERPAVKVGIKCAREIRWLYLGSDESIIRLLSILELPRFSGQVVA